MSESTAKSRAETELKALEEKLGNLTCFIKTVGFRELKPAMRRLLRRQAFHMKRYAKILWRRIEIWDK